ncbi:long polar fimbrial protein LpfD [Salmonella enterica]|uniref:long polar fimbrial protein LpfD n=1 Tax=Salmonella enterica TaxID=28901 RepID=UPI000B53EFFB|nr:long polar fimbrial protein LpfD [Salmonella enterica]ASG69269.1 long polar fimbrial protein LpfD [Salmonella enterica subsp. enterica serovar Waycross]EBW4444172.1 long polar fimbrial protein LpfD [Salmonella enterica subsp. enterica serovar Arechavaleta]EDU9618153.1 long polar fimbrial protein LpfD [Salmonella enterica subsp. enterica serovar Haifa]
MLKKLIMFTGLLGGSVLFSGQALAAADWGPCTPTGGTHNFTGLLEKTVTDVSRNASGATFPDFWSWDLGGNYQAVCECLAGADNKAPVYYKAIPQLAPGHSESGRQYYIVNNNIQVSADIWIQGQLQKYVTVPFSDRSNDYASHDLCDVDSTGGFITTGSKGKLSLYINHPFVGQLDIPSTNIVDLFGTRKAGVYGATPMASVYLSGRIIVPQGCELSTGSTLEIPFGEFKASDFKDRKGQMPTGAASITKELQFKCTNISDGIKIFLRIEGMPNASDSNAIDMGNPDIGAVIEGANGKILVPNDASVNQELSVSGLVDDTHRTASTTISAYPISTTGKLPAAGDFEGIATMRIDVE